MGIKEEFKSRNFSIYGQWTGVLCIIVLLAVGIANIFEGLAHPVKLIFAGLAIVSGLLLIFVEIPLLLRICPTSQKFDSFVRRFSTNYMRAAIYGVMAAVQWASISTGPSSLIAAAVMLTFAATFYLLAGLRNHEFAGSKTLGGAGVAQMIV